jgi:hypothetical protein
MPTITEKDAASRFFSSSLLTPGAYAYRRGPGQQYLKTTLTGVLSNLCSQSNLILEINPLKVLHTRCFL